MASTVAIVALVGSMGIGTAGPGRQPSRFPRTAVCPGPSCFADLGPPGKVCNY